MFKKIQLLTILTVLFSLPCLAIAANGFEAPDISAGLMTVVEIFFGPEAKAYTTDPVSILQFLIFPFIALWAVLYGILTTLKIFRYQNRLNSLLSFLIAVIACPTGGLVWIVRTVFVYMGGWGFVAFAILFFVGVGAWLLSGVIRFGQPLSKYFSKAGRLEDEIYIIRQQLDAARAAGAPVTPLRNKLEKKIREWERAKRKITEEHRAGS